MGPLVLRVTDTGNGRSTDVDASGTAIFDFGQDGSMLWHVVGPIIAALPDGRSNLPRGLYQIDGVYTVAFTPTRHITISLTHGTIHNVCDDIA